VTGKHERGEAGLNDVNAEFLMQLADQAGLGGFPLLNLTAWKLPHACQMFTMRSFADENPAIDVNKRRGGDQKNLAHRGVYER